MILNAKRKEGYHPNSKQGELNKTREQSSQVEQNTEYGSASNTFKNEKLREMLHMSNSKNCGNKIQGDLYNGQIKLRRIKRNSEISKIVDPNKVSSRKDILFIDSINNCSALPNFNKSPCKYNSGYQVVSKPEKIKNHRSIDRIKLNISKASNIANDAFLPDFDIYIEQGSLRSQSKLCVSINMNNSPKNYPELFTLSPPKATKQKHIKVPKTFKGELKLKAKLERRSKSVFRKHLK